MSPIENVVIAAAGMGTRLGAGKPKCLVDVCGRKLIEYQLDMLKDVKNYYKDTHALASENVYQSIAQGLWK